MKIFFIKYNTLKIIIIALILLIVFTFIFTYVKRTKSTETFNNGDVFYKGNIDKQIIAFACNVDWGNEYIPAMLQTFRNNDIKITFFVTGRWAEKYQGLLKNIHKEGHEIGNHGYKHRDYSKLGYEENKKEITRAHNIIMKVTGEKPKYFAPPAGAFNDFTIKAANDLDYDVIMWSIDTIDWRKDSKKEKIIQRVISKTHNSAIVLMHPKQETIKALPELINSLEKQGYKIGKVSDIIR
ncbi:polysaccharide deacetylase family protein [Caldisalinibacter kiritimatiensis]|uniref:Putative olysaccharide deacetylase n=1 Tax=Caldisalinibacter kiritimatiensis TaxID=1304284 RepID=R1CEB0_9FIRM|nr:polysaccharide deacetylase family protein [Caldisalinibacter kiritimatiensis]EOD00630.1 Putative olysaccharide deacetylase [Caldisalinibacter kiritimatiensis]